MVEANREVVWSFSDLWFPHLCYPFKARMRPQVARSLVNVVCPRGGKILDPFTGSGTTNVEAYLCGVDSVGIDIIPFYVYMSRAKLEFFESDIDWDPFNPYGCKHPISRVVYSATHLLKTKTDYVKRMGEIVRLQKAFRRFKPLIKPSRHEFHVGSATEIPFPECSFDGIVTSPPYGSAIDYLKENPGPPELMEIPENLKPSLIMTRDVEGWKRIMAKAVGEMHRVLKPNGRLAIIIGNQKRNGSLVDLVGWTLREMAGKNMKLLYRFTELISSTGTRNILTDEVLIFEKT
jgi:tRNA G10  N-methylase Trm11